MSKDPMQFLNEYRVAWQILLITGMVMILIGGYVGLDPFTVFFTTLGLAIPVIILAFATLLVYNGLRVRPLGGIP